MAIDLSFPEPALALVTIDNPARRNALGPTEVSALAETWDRLRGLDAVRCVVVTGRGEQAFCAGAQLDADFSVLPALDERIDAALLKTTRFDKPLVAAVNGHCVAGGLELMLACDIRVASAQARLGLPETRWGILPSGGGAMKLIEQIGHARAMQLMLTAELIDAPQALAFGLVNRVVPAAEVLPEALRIARGIAANSPLALRLTKQAALGPRTRAWRALEPDERTLAARMRASADARIGRQAFLTRTTPCYPDDTGDADAPVAPRQLSS